MGWMKSKKIRGRNSYETTNTALDVDCPYCGAKRGVNCSTKGGTVKEDGDYHDARWDAFEVTAERG